LDAYLEVFNQRIVAAFAHLHDGLRCEKICAGLSRKVRVE
jgi:hypothetical protein